MTKTISISLMAIIFTTWASPNVAADKTFREGHLLIRFAGRQDGKQLTAAEKNATVQSLGLGEIKREYKLVPGLTLVTLPHGQSVENALRSLKGTRAIVYAEPDYKMKLLSTFPNEPRFNELWGLHNIGQSGGTPDADIDAPEAWDIATTSDIIVAVIDSGVDYTHPDLAPNMWRNLGEIPGNGTDDDRNGYKDDVLGWDFYAEVNNPMDYLGHGTSVAGIIGAVGNNAQGVTGICWHAQIMALSVTHYDLEGWEVFVSNAVEAIEYAVANGARIINASWGNNGNISSLEDAIYAANEEGVLIVAAVGNVGWDIDSNPIYPASYECSNIITAMATDAQDQRSVWGGGYSSNYGITSVDLAAPGSNILSCWLGGSYAYNNGTSVAAPYIAGACALIWSLRPDLDHLTVKNIILNSVDFVPDLYERCVTSGRLNLFNALMNTPSVVVSKVDDVNDGHSVLPGDVITYTISYINSITDPCNPRYIGTLTNVNIVDYLPDEVDYNSSSPPGTYNAIERTITWSIESLSPGEPNSVKLTVKVNQQAEPLGTITNLCVLGADEIQTVSATEVTDVNTWCPPVIYVDVNAAGSITGMSWKNAYRDLQVALDRASQCFGSSIWVAAGTYTPSVPDYDPTFQLVNGVSLYGHFAGNETSPNQRNLHNPNNETILSGLLVYAYNVVTATNVNAATILDGFTVTGASSAGIKAEDANLIITNCLIGGNAYRGIDAFNSRLTIANCYIHNNHDRGINANFNNNSSLGPSLFSQNIICNNGSAGIYCANIGSDLKVTNNRIHHNCWYYQNEAGIFVDWAGPAVIIRNNTIVANTGYGILDWYGGDAVVTSCIVWNNTNDLDGCTATYSCIEDDDSGIGNIHSDPCFIDSNDPNDYHLSPNSLCIDAGDPAFNDFNETDIDGECRIIDGDHDNVAIVDIGCDEHFWSRADLNGDGVVNFVDYVIFAPHWHTQNADVNLAGDLDIEMDDLAAFCADWLWVAPWSDLYETLMSQPASGMGMASGEMLFGESISLMPLLADESQAIQAEQPVFTEMQIEELIEWFEQVWESDAEVREAITEADMQEFLDSLKEQL